MEVKDLLNARGISYITKGRDHIVKCLNPEHEDTHPSMRIDKITGVFNCFSCGFKGNLFTYFGEKVNKLQMKRETLKKKINNKIAENVGLIMPTNSVPYIGDWRNIKPDTYKKFEAFLDHSPTFVGRVMFPIRNFTGRIVAFQGRHMTGGTPKYIFSPPGVRLPLFPVVEPIFASVILVEGIFDVLNLHDKGLTNAVCCFGTKNINEDKLAILKLQGVERIDIFFDGDDPGQEAAKSVKVMCDNVDLVSRNVFIEGQDPGNLTTDQVNKLMRKLY
jgi:DNA primase